MEANPSYKLGFVSSDMQRSMFFAYPSYKISMFVRQICFVAPVAECRVEPAEKQKRLGLVLRTCSHPERLCSRSKECCISTPG